MVAQIFVTTVEPSRVMRDKDSVMSFRYDLLIALYRNIFFLQAVIHNTINMSMFIRKLNKEISVESTEIVCNLHLRSSLFLDFT